MENKKVVLAVDDMSENLTALKIMLQDTFDVRLCKSAKAALTLLKSTPTDLILLDIEMPDLSGFQFLDLLHRTIPGYREIPVIFVTSHTSPDLLRQAAEAGVKDYLVKPIQKEVLFNRILSLIP